MLWYCPMALHWCSHCYGYRCCCCCSGTVPFVCRSGSVESYWQWCTRSLRALCAHSCARNAPHRAWRTTCGWSGSGQHMSRPSRACAASPRTAGAQGCSCIVPLGPRVELHVCSDTILRVVRRPTEAALTKTSLVAPRGPRCRGSGSCRMGPARCRASPPKCVMSSRVAARPQAGIGMAETSVIGLVRGGFLEASHTRRARGGA